MKKISILFILLTIFSSNLVNLKAFKKSRIPKNIFTKIEEVERILINLEIELEQTTQDNIVRRIEISNVCSILYRGNEKEFEEYETFESLRLRILELRNKCFAIPAEIILRYFSDWLENFKRESNDYFEEIEKLLKLD